MSERKLNQAQKEAVEYTTGPLLIVAGAGTGKTTVVTEKIGYLINKGLAKPEEILALTFTDNAALEMQTRVDEKLNTSYSEIQISTFHTFCQRILEQAGLDIGLPNQFKLATETEAWLLMRQHIYDLELDYYRPMGNPAKHIHELIKHFSKCKDELIAPEDYLKYVESLILDQDSEQNSISKFKIQSSKFKDDIATEIEVFESEDSAMEIKRLNEKNNNQIKKWIEVFIICSFCNSYNLIFLAVCQCRRCMHKSWSAEGLCVSGRHICG